MPSTRRSSLYTPRHWPSWLVAGLLRVILLLPYPAVMAVGRGLGRLVKRCAGRRVRIARTNLKLCYPDMTDAERESLIDANFAAMGMGLMEIGMGWWWPHERVERLLIAVEGEEHLPPPDDPRGTIFLTAHFSSLELSGRYLGHRSASHAMYRRNENPVIQALFERFRTQHTIGIIARDDVRTMLKALKAGEGVWFAPDQNFGHKGGVFADFMDVPAATNTATSRFAKMTGARVIPFALFREAGGYRLVIEPPLDDFPSDDMAADTRRINDIYTRWVQRAPEQYNWIHRRFKTRPAGEPPLY
jgi:KDO2-lipid IV(A) lauroyltransferase